MAAGTFSIDNINDEVSRFLYVSQRDVKSRALALQKVQDSVEGWLDGYGSPPPGSAGQMIGLDSMEKKEFIQQMVPELLRLSLRCPFQDVRDKCTELLKDIEERDRAIKVPRALSCGPSRFIPCQDIVPVDTAKEDNQMVFIESFLQNNRLEHLHQVMGCHPRYLEAFMKTQNYLLREDGPLPFPYRHYIAIMAAARHQCLYLVRLHAHDFLLQGGDPTWLKGLDGAPAKLRSLCEINNILAHRPWLLKKEHIEKLTRGNDTWSLSEMMQALIIISHFHTLCSFIYGCGITPEIDQGGCTMRPASSSGDDESEDYASDSSTGCELNANVLEDSSLEALMERMRQLTESSTLEEGPTQEEMLLRFQFVENQSAEISVPSKEKTSSRKEEVVRFVTDSDFTYSDFAKRAPELDIPTFRVQDYSWEDHGFSLANRLYSDIGNLLEDRFNIAFNLTYYTMGDNCEVDTSAFRQAIWYYIHCMYGIRHDDYDYAQVDQMLERNLKTYIKTITCFPERITKKDYESVMRAFKHSEKVHVNFMITEARMQAELLYALRVVNRYMT